MVRIEKPTIKPANGGMRSSPSTSMAKRIFDIVIASFGAIVLSPVTLLIILLIRVTTGTPVVFRQPRAGQGGRSFTIMKFRTMRDGAGSDAERLTGFGRLLRSTSLDEIPQIINVLKGEMSLIGPRIFIERPPSVTP